MGLEQDVGTALCLLTSEQTVLDEGQFGTITRLHSGRLLKEYVNYDHMCAHQRRNRYGNAEWEFVLAAYLRSKKVPVPVISAIVRVPNGSDSRCGIIMDQFRGYQFRDAKPHSRLIEEYHRQIKRIGKLGIDAYDSDIDKNVLYGLDGKSLLIHDLVRWEMPLDRFEELKRAYPPVLYTPQPERRILVPSYA